MSCIGQDGKFSPVTQSRAAVPHYHEDFSQVLRNRRPLNVESAGLDDSLVLWGPVSEKPPLLFKYSLRVSRCAKAIAFRAILR